MFELEGRTFSVLGLARTGVATANYLARHGADVVASDPKDASRLPLDKLDARVTVVPGENRVRPGDIVIISPGIRPDSQAWKTAHELGSEVLSDIELFYRLAPCPILAVTGTDGKSTTTALAADLVQAMGRKVFLGGNIGVPCMEGLDGLDEHSVAVLEVSCFQLSHCHQLRPRSAIVTNIAEDHVDYYGSMEGYIAAKKRVFANMVAGDTLVLNGEDPVVAEFIPPEGVTLRRFGWHSGFDAWCDRKNIYIELPEGSTHRIPLQKARLQGLHNAENIMAALLAVAPVFGSISSCEEALLAFPGLEHRMEFVAEIHGIQFLNDSKATNPHAAGAVLNAFDEAFVLLAGGSEKGSDFRDLGNLIAKKTKALVVFGATRERIAESVPAGHPVYRVDNLQQAIHLGYELAVPGERVILAPACASFDQFKDFEDRGRWFKQWVAELKEQENRS